MDLLYLLKFPTCQEIDLRKLGHLTKHSWLQPTRLTVFSRVSSFWDLCFWFKPSAIPLNRFIVIIKTAFPQPQHSASFFSPALGVLLCEGKKANFRDRRRHRTLMCLGRISKTRSMSPGESNVTFNQCLLRSNYPKWNMNEYDMTKVPHRIFSDSFADQHPISRSVIPSPNPSGCLNLRLHNTAWATALTVMLWLKVQHGPPKQITKKTCSFMVYNIANTIWEWSTNT